MNATATAPAEKTPPNPWGSCFDATAHNFIANRNEPGIRVCHGVGIANRPGQEGMKMAHAWLEFDSNGRRGAMDCIWLEFFSAEAYRKHLQVTHVVEYEPAEFLRLWTEHDFPGPWDPEIEKHARDARDRMPKCGCGAPATEMNGTLPECFVCRDGREQAEARSQHSS